MTMAIIAPMSAMLAATAQIWRVMSQPQQSLLIALVLLPEDFPAVYVCTFASVSSRMNQLKSLQAAVLSG